MAIGTIFGRSRCLVPEAPPPTSRYKFRVEDCQVQDRAALTEYRGKRNEWLGWYEHSREEPNSIQQQLFSMIFIDLTYRIVYEPRLDASVEKIAAKRGLLMHLLDQCYVANQVLAIRRLLDDRKDVISLRRLLTDIFRNRHLFTREIYVCYDGLPYESESWQSLPQDDEKRIFGIDAPGLSNYMGSRVRHEVFDRLSGVSPEGRTRTDRIRDGVFDKLEGWIRASPADKLITLSHKFFAHAATPDSRGSIEYSGIKLVDIAEIHRALVRVERAITDQILFIAVARDVVPLPPLGLLKGLDNPYVLSNSIEKMYQRWDELSDERNKWSRGIAEDLTI
jgi:hypothetical protein